MGLIDSWKDTISILKQQLLASDSIPAITLESTRNRVKGLYSKSIEESIQLPQPDFEDHIFSGMVFGEDVAELAKSIAEQEANILAHREIVKRNEKAWRRRANEALGLKSREPKVPKTGLNRCQCGCGALVKGRWANHHPERWITWMKRIERGKMRREDLPKYVQDRVRWAKCRRCAGWIPTKDTSDIEIVDRIGYVCRMWMKRKGEI